MLICFLFPGLVLSNIDARDRRKWLAIRNPLKRKDSEHQIRSWYLANDERPAKGKGHDFRNYLELNCRSLAAPATRAKACEFDKARRNGITRCAAECAVRFESVCANTSFFDTSTTCFRAG